MTSITNYEVYTKRMKSTYYDKCWWINHIPNSINVIVDFGCADAGIFDFIEAMFPGKFTYIGIDESEEMLALAGEKFDGNDRVEFYSSIKEMKENSTTNISSGIMLFNSVMHEILSYSSPIDLLEFFEEINSTDIQYIAIRDMHAYADDYSPLAIHMNVQMHRRICMDAGCQYESQFKEHQKISDHPISGVNFFLEFLLKYFYTENWSREVKEKYLWNWSAIVFDKLICNGYTKKHEEDFSIKYLEEKWFKDFGIQCDAPTHKKMLLKKEN